MGIANNHSGILFLCEDLINKWRHMLLVLQVIWSIFPLWDFCAVWVGACRHNFCSPTSPVRVLAAVDLCFTERTLCVRMGLIGYFCTLGFPTNPGQGPDARIRPGLTSLSSIPDKETLHCADSSLTPLHITNRLTTICQGINLDFNTTLDPNENFLSNAWVPIELYDFLKFIDVFSWHAARIFAVQSIRTTSDCYIAGMFAIYGICWYNYIVFFSFWE